MADLLDRAKFNRLKERHNYKSRSPSCFHCEHFQKGERGNHACTVDGDYDTINQEVYKLIHSFGICDDYEGDV